MQSMKRGTLKNLHNVLVQRHLANKFKVIGLKSKELETNAMLIRVN